MKWPQERPFDDLAATDDISLGGWPDAADPQPHAGRHPVSRGKHLADLKQSPPPKRKRPAAAAAPVSDIVVSEEVIAQGTLPAKKRQSLAAAIKEQLAAKLPNGIGRIHALPPFETALSPDKFFSSVALDTVYRAHSTTVGPFFCQCKSVTHNNTPPKRVRYFQFSPDGAFDKHTRFVDALSAYIISNANSVPRATAFIDRLLDEGPKKPMIDASTNTSLLGPQEAPAPAPAPAAPAAADDDDDDDDESVYSEESIPVPVTAPVQSAPEAKIEIPLSTFLRMFDTMQDIIAKFSK